MPVFQQERWRLENKEVSMVFLVVSSIKTRKFRKKQANRSNYFRSTASRLWKSRVMSEPRCQPRVVETVTVSYLVMTMANINILEIINQKHCHGRREDWGFHCKHTHRYTEGSWERIWPLVDSPLPQPTSCPLCIVYLPWGPQILIKYIADCTWQLHYLPRNPETCWPLFI